LDLKNHDITASLRVFIRNGNGNYTEITNPGSYIVTIPGVIQLKYQVIDFYGNVTNSEISLDVASGAPVLTGISNLQTALNPRTGFPMNLLTGIKATDLKNQDISQNIKVFLKNAEGNFTQITNPTTYTVAATSIIQLKYEISDSYGHKVDEEISLNILS
jgi:hypothetical protein